MNVTASVSIAGVRQSFSKSGLQSVLNALEVGSEGFGMTDSDGAEAGEVEAWAFIDLVRTAVDSFPPATVPSAIGLVQPIDPFMTLGFTPSAVFERHRRLLPIFDGALAP